MSAGMLHACAQHYVRGKVVSASDVELVTYAMGSGADRRVLLVNAIGMAAALVAPLARALGTQREVVTWDARISPGPAGLPGSTDDTAEAHLLDLQAVLDHYSGPTEPVVLLGWSNGADLAWRYALRRPNRVSALVLINPYVAGAMVESEFARKHEQVYTRVTKRPELAELFARIMGSERNSAETIMTGVNTNEAEVADLVSRTFRSPDALRRHAFAIAGLARAPHVDVDQPLRVPTLFVTGGSDVIVCPRSTARLAQRQRASLWCDPAAGHYVPCRPEAATTMIETFLLQATSCPYEMTP